jgi:hypothetical protein
VALTIKECAVIRSKIALALALVLVSTACAERQANAPTWMDRIEARCADENPIETVERDACVNTHIGNERRAAQRQADQERAQARERHERQARLDEEIETEASLTRARRGAAVGAAMQDLGQSMQDFGRRLAAPPVQCTSIRMGTMTSTTCR